MSPIINERTFCLSMAREYRAMCHHARNNGFAPHSTNELVRISERVNTLRGRYRRRRGIIQLVHGFHITHVLYHGQGINTNFCLVLGLGVLY